MIEYEKEKIVEREKPVLTIARREYGYAGIYGIGITSENLLITVSDMSSLPINSATRIVENEPVEGALSAPMKVFLDPSLACPLQCPFCLAGVPTAREKRLPIPSIAREKIIKINNQLIEAGVLQVKIGGGEPFIYPYFWQTIDQLGEAGIALSTSTSGFALNDTKFFLPSYIETLKRNRVKISISVDGEPTFHNKIRGREGLLETALQGRLRLLEYGTAPKKIELRATIINTPESMDQLDYLNNLSRELNTCIRIRLALPTGSATINNVAFLFPDRQFWSLYEKMRRYAKENPLLNVEEIIRFDKEPYLKTGLDCSAGTRSAFIDMQGNFMPCGFIDEHFPVPSHNLFTEGKSILELWRNGEAFTTVRSYLRKENEENPCAQCDYVHSCQGGCPSVRLSLKMRSDPRCPIEKKVFVPVTIVYPETTRDVFANLTTGSLLLYRPNDEEEPYVVFTGEIDGGRLILTTPGGKMNAELDNNLSDTSRREIEEELGINPDDLQAIPTEKTRWIVTDGQIISAEASRLTNYLDEMEKPLATIIHIPDKNSYSTSALIVMYGYTTRRKPTPTPESPFVIIIPQSKLTALSQVDTLGELNNIGTILAIKDCMDVSLPVMGVGIAEQLIHHGEKIYNKIS